MGYEVLGREGFVDASCEQSLVGARGYDHGERLLAVASASPGFLIVFFERWGQVVVHHQAHIGFVNAHAEGVGGYHDSHFATLPSVLAHLFVLGVEAGVVGFGRYAGVGEECGEFAGAASRAHIYYGGA